MDGAIALGLFFLLHVIVSSRFGEPTLFGVNLSPLPTIVAAILVILIMLVYFVAAEATLGATLGKVVAEARVQNATTGQMVGFEAAVVRNIMRVVDGIGLYLVGGICVMLTPRRQRLGDLLARTVVVHRPTHPALRIAALLVGLGIVAAEGLGGLALGASARPIGPARITNVYVTDNPNAESGTSAFSPDTKKIYLLFTLADAPIGTVVKASWFGPATSGSQTGFPLGEAEIRTGGLQSGGTFTLDTPPGGWVSGVYHSDLYVNGTLERTVSFRVGTAISTSVPAAATAGATPAPAPTLR